LSLANGSGFEIQRFHSRIQHLSRLGILPAVFVEPNRVLAGLLKEDGDCLTTITGRDPQSRFIAQKDQINYRISP